MTGGIKMNLFSKNNTVKAATDPVCGMGVIPCTTDITAKVDGDTYY
jgi:hypothetical protein